MLGPLKRRAAAWGGKRRAAARGGKRRAAARGGSLVELMVGLALGLLVVAVALAGLAQQTADSRRLLAGVRLDHDVQAAAQLVARHVRRAGRWVAADDAVWRPGAHPGLANPHAVPGADAVTDRFDFSYDPASEPAGPAGSFGVRLQANGLQFLLGGAAWQGLTDAETLTVTRFDVGTRSTDTPLGVPCARPCSDGASCGPRARHVAVDLRFEAQAPRLPRWQRTPDRHVQLRNDVLVDGCPP